MYRQEDSSCLWPVKKAAPPLNFFGLFFVCFCSLISRRHVFLLDTTRTADGGVVAADAARILFAEVEEVIAVARRLISATLLAHRQQRLRVALLHQLQQRLTLPQASLSAGLLGVAKSARRRHL